MSSQTPLAADNAAPQPQKNRRGFLLRLLGVAVILAAAGWTAWYFLDGRWYEGTDDAYVNGYVVQVTPHVPGTVVTIGADDGDLVHAGDVLVKLDPSNTEVALAEAKASLASTSNEDPALPSRVFAPAGPAPTASERELMTQWDQLPANQRAEKAGHH